MKEDYERVQQLDKIYLIEHQQEIEEDYYLWQEDQDRLPARIEIINKKHKHENRKIKI